MSRKKNKKIQDKPAAMDLDKLFEIELGEEELHQVTGGTCTCRCNTCTSRCNTCTSRCSSGRKPSLM